MKVEDEDQRVDLSGDVAAGALPAPAVAAQQLRQRFLSWQAAEPQLLEDVTKTPRLNDAGAASNNWVRSPKQACRAHLP